MTPSSRVAFFRLRNDLYCVEWGVKLYSLTHLFTVALKSDGGSSKNWKGAHLCVRPANDSTEQGKAKHITRTDPGDTSNALMSPTSGKEIR